MLISVGLTVLFIAILVFVLGKAIGFPDKWEWIDLILASAGIAMTATGVFQAIAGRPILVATYERGVLENQRNLHITLRNIPLNKGGIWKRLGVERETIHSIEVYYQTSEAGSNAVIQGPIRAKIYDDSDSTMKNRVMLPPTLIPGVSVFIADWDEHRSAVLLKGDELHPPLPLKPGSYSLDINFVVNGESRHVTRGFTVGGSADLLMWVLPNPDRLDYRIR